MNIKHISSFSSTSDYQQFWNGNNIYFFTFCYSLTASAITSVIKFATSLALSTAVISTITDNYAVTTFGSCIQLLLNEAEKQYYYDNNLCFYCKRLNHWLSNCF